MRYRAFQFGRWLLCVFCLLTLATARERPWRKVVTPTFTILTSGEDRAALRWAAEFSQFVAGLGTFVKVDQRELPKLTIVIFADESDFRPYRPLKGNGKPKEVAGFFSRRESWSIAGLGDSDLDQDTRRTIFHEGTHWFTSAATAPYPVWLDEGLAEAFSTFEVDSTGVVWGKPITNHLRILEHLHPMPLERLLFLARSDLFGEDADAVERTGLVYAQSWLFVHCLVFGKRDLPPHALMDYVRLLRQEDPDKAFHEAFGRGYKEMEEYLHAYLNGGKYYISKRPLAQLPPPKVEPATAFEVDEALGRLALVAGHTDEARHRAAMLTSREPNSPRGYELLGEIGEETNDSGAALAAYREAIARKSTDYRPYFAVALAKHRALESGDGIVQGLSNADARELCDNYGRAVELRRFEDGYASFANVFPALDAPTDHDRAILAEGQALYPKNGSIRIAMAAIDYRAGKVEAAHRALAELLADPDPSAVSVRTIARAMDATWHADEVITRLDQYMEKREFEKGLKLIDATVGEVTDFGFRAQLQSIRKQFVASSAVQAIDAAMQEQKWSDARRLLHALLESDAPPAFKQAAHSMLADLDRQGLGDPAEPVAP